MKIKRRVFFMADEGAGDGGAFDPSSRLNGGKEGKVVAKYVTQLSKEYQDDDFTGIETLDELYKSNKTQKAKIAELEEKGKNALHIPTAESTDEEIKDFFTKIGMPETPEGYGLKDYDENPEEIKTLKANFLKEAFNNGLTKGQANNLWKQQLATYSSFKSEAQRIVTEAQKNYKGNYDTLLKAEYPDDSKRAERFTFEDNLIKEFTAETGLGDILAKTGIALNPEAMHKLAVYHEAHGNRRGSNGAGRGSGSPAKMDIHDAMVDIYNRKGK